MHRYLRLWRPAIATIFALALASCGGSNSSTGGGLVDTGASSTAAVAQKPSAASTPAATDSKGSDADVRFAP